MWIFALTDARIYLGIGFIISFITDMLNGPIARKLNQTSNFGSKFDSLADQLLQISAILWIYLLMPEVFAENLLITLIALITYITSLAVGLIKYRRFADLHLYLTKLGGFFISLRDPCSSLWSVQPNFVFFRCDPLNFLLC
jgi:CDP-diacylglycerol--glycerol-3-phosphate 3-phosphatidyltransferase